MAIGPGRWKYVEAVFVPPGIPHPLWRDPFGKQLHGEPRSTPRFLQIINVIRLRQWDDQSVHGTYEWRDGCWRLLGESTIAGLTVHCPDELAPDVRIIDTDAPDE